MLRDIARTAHLLSDESASTRATCNLSDLGFCGSKVLQNVRFPALDADNCRAKFDAASFILGGEICNCTNTHTQTHTHTNINYTATPGSGCPTVRLNCDTLHIPWQLTSDFTAKPLDDET